MRVAIYAGTFDPITLGHVSVIKRLSVLFERLIVLVAVNPDKKPLFSATERVSLIQDAVHPLQNVRVEQTEGWVAEYARKVGAGFLIRGVRGTTDMESEHQLAALNQQIAPEVTTLFVPAESALCDVSSSRIKQLATEGRDLSSFCTPLVAKELLRRLQHPENPERSHAP